GRPHRSDLVAGRYQVRLRQVVEVGRAAAAVGADRIDRPVGTVMGVRGPDGDRAGLVAGRGDRAIGELAVAVLTLIAGRADDDEAGLHRAAHGRAERIGGVALPRIVAQGHVDHPDVVGALVRDAPTE